MTIESGQEWAWFDSGRGIPAGNMAWDEVLLQGAAMAGGPTLRFYGWAEPAATFGYSQRYREVAAWTSLRPLLRRPTGGGLVPHDSDWTYSFTVPPGHSWYQSSAVESYRSMHAWVVGAFRRLGIETELAASSRRAVPGQCFVGAERHDVLWQGRKVAGAAQRRNRQGLLIQGSVQPPPLGLRREDWQAAMLEEAVGGWSVRWTVRHPDAGFASLVADLVLGRYGRATYHEQR